uniref:Uncharacterized protein n=1 Tax=Panagrolaimus davidi TaxID=227884 RepID=A0A914Q104_9BILA
MSVESCETAVFMDDGEPDGAAADVAAPVAEQRVPQMQQAVPGMMKYGAACSNSYVSRIIFGPSGIKLKLDTFETLQVPQDAELFNDICNITHATHVLVLVFVKCADNVYNAAVWEKFASSTSSVIFSGTISFQSMPLILPNLKNAVAMNFHAFRVARNGCLREIAKYFPTSVEKLYFDTRGTTDSTFVANVNALYEGLYTNRHHQIPCFKEITLIVNDLPGNASLQTQVHRLAEMLKDEDSFAVVITTKCSTRSISNNLRALGYNRSHDGYVANTKNAMELFNYWSTICNGRNIVLGLAEELSIAASP